MALKFSAKSSRKRPLYNVSSLGRLRESILLATSSCCDHFRILEVVAYESLYLNIYRRKKKEVLLKVARYYLFAWAAAVLKSDFQLLNSIRLLRYFRHWKRNDWSFSKRSFIEIDTSIRKFSAIFLNVVFKENAYFRENEKTFFLHITLNRCWYLKDFRDQVSAEAIIGDGDRN